MPKPPKVKLPKPIRYYDLDGQLCSEYLPPVLPEWFAMKVGKWLRYKANHGRDWYYYEVRLINRWPVARKFADLWFLDHLERDHGPDNPILWHERILYHWIMAHYGQEMHWFNHVNPDKISTRAYQRVRRYGLRYYPIGFNPSMRLIYHGCTEEEYSAALDRTRTMLDESVEYWEKDYRKQVQRYNRYKRQQAKKKAQKDAKKHA